MLTGEKPFVGATTADVLAAILKSEPEDPGKFSNDVPVELKHIALKTLRKSRDERFKSAKDLYVDLRALKKRLEIAAAREVSEPLAVADGLSSGVEPSSESNAPDGVVDPRNSIAVMPFANMSGDAENEYFCDGLAEEILNALAKIENLKVAARTSAFSFKGKNLNVSKIGTALSVKTVLEGSVRRSGSRLRIMAQLVSASDGYNLWSERYDREMKNVFEVQDEITLAIVDALKMRLLGEKRAAVLKHHVENTEAYELFLKGRYYCNKHTIEGLLKGIEYFEKAIEIEPEYAAAYAEIGICCVVLSHFGLFSPHEIFPKGKTAVARALEIDNQSADGHSAMANILFYYEWDWPAAGREFERAIELNPNDANTRWRFGLFLVSQGRFATAIHEGEQAVRLDPLSLLAHLYAGFIYLLADRPELAFEQVTRMTEIEPNFHWAYWLKGSIYLTQEKYGEAVGALEKSMALGGTPVVKSYLGSAYGFSGKRDEALRVLKELLETRQSQYVAAFNIARVNNALGEIDSTFAWLEKAIDERNGEIVLLTSGGKRGMRKIWRQILRDDARYEDILRRIGFSTDRTGPTEAGARASGSRTAIVWPPTSVAELPE